MIAPLGFAENDTWRNSVPVNGILGERVTDLQPMKTRS
jgi:hypothetical protein